MFRWFSLCSLFVFPCFLCANGNTEFDVQLGGAPSGCSPWDGPGVYYGIGFDSPGEYYDWCRSHYYGPGINVWYGPGWYGGYWFDDEDHWHNWRHGGDYHGGGHYHGGGGHHGGGHGGGGHGGGGHH